MSGGVAGALGRLLGIVRGDRSFASRGLCDPEIDELGGSDLLWEALNSYILLFLEGVSLADIAPATDAASSDHVGHKVH